MAQLILDVAPDPVGVGATVAVVLLIIGFLLLLGFGLVAFLWYRKRSLRGVEMIRPDTELAQPSKPNQP